MKLKIKITNQDTSSDYFRFATDSVRMILKGQGLEHKNVWNGVISLDDSISLVQHNQNVNPIDEGTLTISNPTVNEEEFTATFAAATTPITNVNTLEDDGVTVTIQTDPF